MMRTRKRWCEPDCSDDEGGSDSGYDWGHCEDTSDKYRIDSGCECVLDGGNESRLRRSGDGQGIKGFSQNYQSNGLHFVPRHGVLRL